MKIPLREIAHARAGDKGDISNVAVFPYDESNYNLLKEQLTAERVQSAFDDLVEGPVTRYEVPGVNGFNFVMEGGLGGGATTTLRIDVMGKTMSSALLTLEVEVDEGFVGRSSPECPRL